MKDNWICVVICDGKIDDVITGFESKEETESFVASVACAYCTGFKLKMEKENFESDDHRIRFCKRTDETSIEIIGQLLVKGVVDFCEPTEPKEQRLVIERKGPNPLPSYYQYMTRTFEPKN